MSGNFEKFTEERLLTPSSGRKKWLIVGFSVGVSLVVVLVLAISLMYKNEKLRLCPDKIKTCQMDEICIQATHALTNRTDYQCHACQTNGPAVLCEDQITECCPTFSCSHATFKSLYICKKCHHGKSHKCPDQQVCCQDQVCRYAYGTNAYSCVSSNSSIEVPSYKTCPDKRQVCLTDQKCVQDLDLETKIITYVCEKCESKSSSTCEDGFTECCSPSTCSYDSSAATRLQDDGFENFSTYSCKTCQGPLISCPKDNRVKCCLETERCNYSYESKGVICVPKCPDGQETSLCDDKKVNCCESDNCYAAWSWDLTKKIYACHKRH